MKAEALAELDAEDLVRADDYYHSRPYFRSADKPVDFYNRFTPPEDFYKNKKPVLCAAHVVGIGDPYRNMLQSAQAIHRKLEDWTVRLQSDEPGYPVMYGKATQSYEEDRRNIVRRKAEDMLAYERAKFQADCAARNIRTTEDAERALTRIAVARADVVSQDILDLHVTLSNVVWAGGTGGAPRQPATYGI